jgi:hypothetical protein
VKREVGLADLGGQRGREGLVVRWGPGYLSRSARGVHGPRSVELRRQNKRQTASNLEKNTRLLCANGWRHDQNRTLRANGTCDYVRTHGGEKGPDEGRVGQTSGKLRGTKVDSARCAQPPRIQHTTHNQPNSEHLKKRIEKKRGEHEARTDGANGTCDVVSGEL